MIQELFSSIKEDKKLSINHWRYRLLHWVFEIKFKSVDDSWLPKALYTHYCPLFHITNFLAFFIWAIAPAKLAIFIIEKFIRILGSIIYLVVVGLAHLFGHTFQFELSEAELEKLREKRWLEDEARQFRNRLKKYYVKDVTDFDSFWQSYKFCYTFLTPERALAEWKLFIERQEEIEAEKEAKKKEYARFVFLVNFSRVFIKWMMYLGYVLLGLLISVFLLFVVLPILIKIVVFFATFDWFWLVGLVLKPIVGCVILGLIVYVCAKLTNTSGKMAEAFKVPFRLTKDILVACFSWLKKTNNDVRSFMSVFYEENCPAIILEDVEPSNEDEGSDEEEDDDDDN